LLKPLLTTHDCRDIFLRRFNITKRPPQISTFFPYTTLFRSLGNFSLLITILGIVLPIYIFINMIVSKDVTKDERSRVYSYVPLYITSVAFWMIHEQGATILARFADKKTK